MIGQFGRKYLLILTLVSDLTLAIVSPTERTLSCLVFIPGFINPTVQELTLLRRTGRAISIGSFLPFPWWDRQSSIWYAAEPGEHFSPLGGRRLVFGPFFFPMAVSTLPSVPSQKSQNIPVFFALEFIENPSSPKNFSNLPFSLSPWTLLSFRYFLYLAVKYYIT
ncbi:MAG: hypothetical protein GY696_35255 [Gammaproteobacteria bacterium]|nr:hypothetical protein [Gammaproteobacteria bacterium]